MGDGTEVLMRPIREDDGALLRDLFANMTAEDRRRRFFAPMRALSDALVERLSHVDYRHDIALLALNAETSRLLGVVRLASEGEEGRGEFAIALRSDFKGHGLGWVMMERLIRIAARLGITEVYGYVLHDNEPMLRLAREFGFTTEPGSHEAGAVTVRRAVGRDANPI